MESNKDKKNQDKDEPLSDDEKEKIHEQEDEVRRRQWDLSKLLRAV